MWTGCQDCWDWSFTANQNISGKVRGHTNFTTAASSARKHVYPPFCSMLASLQIHRRMWTVGVSGCGGWSSSGNSVYNLCSSLPCFTRLGTATELGGNRMVTSLGLQGTLQVQIRNSLFLHNQILRMSHFPDVVSAVVTVIVLFFSIKSTSSTLAHCLCLIILPLSVLLKHAFWNFQTAKAHLE